MSKDEIIETIEELQCEYKEKENEKKYNDYTVFKAKKYSKAVKGLLDLYQKEKEKNKKLEARKYMLNAETGEITAISTDNNYISKDKIKKCIQTPYPEVAVENIVELLEENNGKQM